MKPHLRSAVFQCKDSLLHASDWRCDRRFEDCVIRLSRFDPSSWRRSSLAVPCHRSCGCCCWLESSWRGTWGRIVIHSDLLGKWRKSRTFLIEIMFIWATSLIRVNAIKKYQFFPNTISSFTLFCHNWQEHMNKTFLLNLEELNAENKFKSLFLFFFALDLFILALFFLTYLVFSGLVLLEIFFSFCLLLFGINLFGMGFSGLAMFSLKIYLFSLVFIFPYETYFSLLTYE